MGHALFRRRFAAPLAAVGIAGLALTGCTGDIAAEDAADTDCTPYSSYGTFEGSPDVSIGGTIQDDEADRLEHAVSDELVDRVDRVLGYPTRDPHGDPIPTEAGEIPGEQGTAVTELSNGAAGTVTRVRDGNPAVVRYLSSLGVVVGAKVDVVTQLPEVGTVSIEVDGVGRDIPVAVASAIRIA